MCLSFIAPALYYKYHSHMFLSTLKYLSCHKMFQLTVLCLSEARVVTSLGNAGKFMHYGSV
jgi:hypothetical protein